LVVPENGSMFNGKWNTALPCLDEKSICLSRGLLQINMAQLGLPYGLYCFGYRFAARADLNLIDSILILHRRFEGRLKI
jgi:hypothetical protein